MIFLFYDSTNSPWINTTDKGRPGPLPWYVIFLNNPTALRSNVLKLALITTSTIASSGTSASAASSYFFVTVALSFQGCRQFGQYHRSSKPVLLSSNGAANPLPDESLRKLSLHRHLLVPVRSSPPSPQDPPDLHRCRSSPFFTLLYLSAISILNDNIANVCCKSSGTLSIPLARKSNAACSDWNVVTRLPARTFTHHASSNPLVGSSQHITHPPPSYVRF